MSFTYTAVFDNTAASTATDIFECTTVATDRPVYVWALDVFQDSDLGDAAEEVIHIGLYRAATAGSTGTAVTEQPYVTADAPTATLAINQLRGTASTGGTLIYAIGWNIRIPTLWCPVPEMRPKFAADEDPFTFRMIVAPTDSIDLSATLIWEEI